MKKKYSALKIAAEKAIEPWPRLFWDSDINGGPVYGEFVQFCAPRKFKDFLEAAQPELVLELLDELEALRQLK